MEFVWGILVGGVVIGIVMGLVMKARGAGAVKHEMNCNEAEEKKAENLAKLRELIGFTSERITNDWVQKELSISDATAERYLNDLEGEGLLHQVGDSGQGVYYEKTI